MVETKSTFVIFGNLFVLKKLRFSKHAVSVRMTSKLKTS